MKFTTYKFLIAGLLVLWGILNLTNGFNIIDESQLNIVKGFCGIALGLVIGFAVVDQRITRPLQLI